MLIFKRSALIRFTEKFTKNCCNDKAFHESLRQLFASTKPKRIQYKFEDSFRFELVTTHSPTQAVFLVTEIPFCDTQKYAVEMRSSSGDCKIAFAIKQIAPNNYELILHYAYFLKTALQSNIPYLQHSTAPTYQEIEHHWYCYFNIDNQEKQIDYYFMPLLPGCDLFDLLQLDDKKRPLTIKQKLLLALLISERLYMLHNMGDFVHCDLKPENIRVIIRNPNADTPHEFAEVHLIDKDSIRVPGKGPKNFIFTDIYAPPERYAQHKWPKITQYLDLHALGIIFLSLFFDERLLTLRTRALRIDHPKYTIDKLLTKHYDELRKTFSEAHPTLKTEIRQEIVAHIVPLVYRCVTEQASERYNMEQVYTTLQQLIEIFTKFDEQLKINSKARLKPSVPLPSAPNILF